jgi:hypothetical protein
VDAQVSCLAGLHEPRERSLYPYFLTEHEEKKVAKRINHINQVTAFDFAALYG